MRLATATWFLVSALALAGTQVEVRDSQGQPVPNARIEIVSPSGNVFFSGAANDATPDVPKGAILRVTAPGFAEVLAAPAAALIVTLDPARQTTQVTVSATPGAAEEIQQRPEFILSGESGAGPTVAHSLYAKPGVLLQQTGAGQVSPFVRGLTGYQVLNLIDGVRFNNSTFRSGPNQYMAYLEPSQASHVEAMLGPSGTQYGSDGLGGTIQVLTAAPRFDANGGGWHGDVSIFGQTADLSGGGSGSVSHGTRRLWFLAGVAGHRHNDLRAGGGIDSHNVLTRLFGFTPRQAADQLGNRQRDTAYSQAGAHGKLALRRDALQSLTAWYQRGEVHGLRNTKDLWGGLGRLQSTLSPQILDLFYTRYERLNVAMFDSLSGRFSVNRQQDGGSRQGLRVSDAVTTELNSVRSLGFAGQGLTHLASHTILSLGGEFYDENIRSERWTNQRAVRPLYPDDSTYRIGGMYAQGVSELGRLRAAYGLRYTRVAYSNPATHAWNTPESSQTFNDWTWQASALYKLTPSFAITVLASRGFRAPNLNDLGAIGLQDLGYEVPAREAIPAQALLADSAGEGAISTGQSLSPLTFERLRNLEAGIRWQSDRHRLRLQFFDALLLDPIVRRTLLFPASSIPTTIAGLAVTPIAQTAAQRAQNVVAVASAVDPRALKSFVNDGRARYWGTEASWEFRISSRWLWESSYSFLLGRDLNPNRNIRRLPPQHGSTSLRYVRSRFWAEARLFASGAQERLSGGDRDDERIGASRRRQDIADFYNSARGAEVRGTESLLEIQNRVLPGIADSVRVALYNATPAWATFDINAGVPLAESLSLEAALTNLADRNYRVHGSGIDSPGRSFHTRLRWRF